MTYTQFVWLHIRKSGGSSTRNLLAPEYVGRNPDDTPANFIQSPPEEYNGILNNHRVVLGDLHGRRCLFAKTYLYPDRWDELFSFAFSREPTDRCLSMFFYLWWRGGLSRGLFWKAYRALRRTEKSRKRYNLSYSFDAFLEDTEVALRREASLRPHSIHFTTHTARMWEDITDLEGNVLLTKVFRLENLIGGINQVFETCGIERRIASSPSINKNDKRLDYRPTPTQRAKIERLYAPDYEIYEQAEG